MAWLAAAAPAIIGAVGAGISAFSGGGSGGGVKPFKRTTTASSKLSDQKMQYDEAYDAMMKQMTTDMAQWGQQDRNFFNDFVQPFQQQLIQTNQQLLPGILAKNDEALLQIGKDLVSNEGLKNAFRSNAQGAAGEAGNMSSQLVQQINDLPSEEEAVGQALVGVEKQFQGAGKELARKMASMGRGISEASMRALGIQKATAKAGAAQQAASMNRQEKINALGQGVNIFNQQQQMNTQQLGVMQGIDQSAAGVNPQVAGVQANGGVGDAAKINADLLKTGSMKVLGNESTVYGLEHFDKGHKNPVYLNRDENGNLTENKITANQTNSGDTTIPVTVTHQWVPPDNYMTGQAGGVTGFDGSGGGGGHGPGGTVGFGGDLGLGSGEVGGFDSAGDFGGNSGVGGHGGGHDHG